MGATFASLDVLSKTLDHAFSNPALLEEALTHPSAGGDQRPDYERLEFLGDRVLGLILADILLCRFPAEPEGALAKRHAALACREALVRVAEGIALGRYLRLAEEDEGGKARESPSRLADSLEAVIAALYLDGGLVAARRLVERGWRPLLEEMPAPPQDAKTRLQEWAQGRGLSLPKYETVEQTGPAHRPTFTVRVTVGAFAPAVASGSTKRVAETAAAAGFLAGIEGQSNGN
ncbi:MAG: ribonuclease III [Pseudomonadota bacterium]